MEMDDKRELALRELDVQKVIMDYANQRQLTMQEAQIEFAKIVLQTRANQATSEQSDLRQIARDAQQIPKAGNEKA
jgi:hypothetical protein